MLNLLWRELRFRRNSIIGWGLGLCFFPIVYVGLYPSFADQMAAFQDLLDLPFYQAMGISMGGFEEYAASTVSNFIPLILGIYAVMNGTGTLAGEEDDGRLELIVALPIPRWQIVLVKAVAMGIALFLSLAIVSAAAGLTLMVIGSQVETVVTPTGFFLTLLGAWPLVFAFGTLSLFLGAFSPSRRTALGMAIAMILVSYFGNNLAGMVTSVENVRGIFPFHYFDATASGLINGQSGADMLILLAVSVVGLGLAVFFFQRRNLTVGAWPWQRGKIPVDVV